VSRAVQERLRRLDQAEAALAILAFALLICRLGFPALQLPPGVVFAWSALLPLGLFLGAMYRLLWVHDPWRYLAFRPARYLVLLAILLELAGIAAWSSGQVPGAALLAGELYLVVFLVGFAGSWAKGAILANRWLAEQRVPVLALPAITFAFAILAGAALLSLPGFHCRPLSFLDNLFTAASALCVTGLAVYDISQSLTLPGQVALALLIQVGALGTLTVLAMLRMWQRERLSAGERAAFGEMVGSGRLDALKKNLATIFKVALAVEGGGALALWLLWRGQVEHPLLQGGFHAISAFGNAGFSLFSDSFASFRGDPPVLVVLMLLIIAGGMGFPVVAELVRASLGRLLPWSEVQPLSRASRLVLWWSGGLIMLGTASFWIDGWLEGRPRQVLDALFQSVSTRTAGFQVESQLNFGTLGLAATCALMAIGASPQSTGGGAKILVLARLFTRTDGRGSGQPADGLFSTAGFRIALLLLIAYLLSGLAGSLLLCHTERVGFLDTAFEAFSALGTVGLTRDLTPRLSPAGKGIDIALMFAGRVLYPTLAIYLSRAEQARGEAVPWA
jgi:trk system potassium uptake protein TrkH